MNGALPITKWYRLRLNEDKEIVSKSFNHYEEGWATGVYPKPFNLLFDNQVAWRKETWTKEHTYLTTDKKII